MFLVFYVIMIFVYQRFWEKLSVDQMFLEFFVLIIGFLEKVQPHMVHPFAWPQT